MRSVTQQADVLVNTKTSRGLVSLFLYIYKKKLNVTTLKRILYQIVACCVRSHKKNNICYWVKDGHTHTREERWCFSHPMIFQPQRHPILLFTMSSPCAPFRSLQVFFTKLKQFYLNQSSISTCIKVATK